MFYAIMKVLQINAATQTNKNRIISEPKPCTNFSAQTAEIRSFSKVSPLNFKAVLFQHGLNTIEKKEIENLIDNYQEDNEKIKLLGKGTFGEAYKIKLRKKGDAVVKIIRPEIEKLCYGGGDLKKESEVLKNIPPSCKRTQLLIDYFETDKRSYLISSYVKGNTLSKQNDMSQKLLDSITDEIYKYDANGLMFYDLNPNNILVENDKAGFIDFEFMEYKKQNQKDFSALNDYHHISRNLYHPQKSNINSFENRCIGEFIQKIEKNGEAQKAKELVKRYLKSLSKYHENMAKYYEQTKNGVSSDINDKAINYEKTLSKIFKEPNKEIVDIEHDLISMRYTNLNYHLYIHRKNEGKLLENDLENYGDFDIYIEKMNNLAKGISQKLDNLSKQEKDSDIQNYCKINKFYIENFLRKNANKNYYELRQNPQINKYLETISKILISKFGTNQKDKMPEVNMETFNKEYKSIIDKFKDNKKVLDFCDDIKFILDNTLDFIQKEQI